MNVRFQLRHYTAQPEEGGRKEIEGNGNQGPSETQLSTVKCGQPEGPDRPQAGVSNTSPEPGRSDLSAENFPSRQSRQLTPYTADPLTEERVEFTRSQLRQAIAQVQIPMLVMQAALFGALAPQIFPLGPELLMKIAITVEAYIITLWPEEKRSPPLHLLVNKGAQQHEEHVLESCHGRQTSEQRVHKALESLMLDPALARLFEVRIYNDEFYHNYREASVVARFFEPDIIALDRYLIRSIRYGSELRALVAHHVARATSLSPKLQKVRGMLNRLSCATAFWGTCLPVYRAAAAESNDLLAGTIALALAFPVRCAVHWLIKSCESFVAERTALKFDLKAVELTGEPKKYIQALEKGEAMPASDLRRTHLRWVFEKYLTQP